MRKIDILEAEIDFFAEIIVSHQSGLEVALSIVDKNVLLVKVEGQRSFYAAKSEIAAVRMLEDAEKLLSKDIVEEEDNDEQFQFTM